MRRHGVEANRLYLEGDMSLVPVHCLGMHIIAGLAQVAWGQHVKVVNCMTNLRTDLSVRERHDAHHPLTKSKHWLCQNMHKLRGYVGHGIAIARFCNRDEILAPHKGSDN